MLHVNMARWVGTAPGTTTLGQPMPGAIFPTQAVLEPSPNSDMIRIALPPNQWATGPTEMLVNVPAHEKNFGPVPTDLQVQRSGLPYMPVHRSWIANKDGPNIYHLQGRGSGIGITGDTALKWGVAVSVITAIALITTTFIAVDRHRKGR